MSTTAPDLTPEQQRIAELEAELAKRDQSSSQPTQDESQKPWNVAKENAQEENTRQEAPVPYRGPGAVLHKFPILTGGSGGNIAGPWVRKLAELLAEAGYSTNNVIKGLVTHFDDSLAADVSRFKADHGVSEPVSAYQGHTRPAEEIAQNLVGPYTVQALLEHVAEKVGQPVEHLIARVEHEVNLAQQPR